MADTCNQPQGKSGEPYAISYDMRGPAANRLTTGQPKIIIYGAVETQAMLIRDGFWPIFCQNPSLINIA